MFDKLKSMLTSSDSAKSKSLNLGGYSSYGGGWGLSSVMGCYSNGSYDNTFPSITKIAEAFMTVAPYAIDAKGERLATRPRLLEAIYNPNRQMSSVDFFEALMVMLLVHPSVYLLCWRYEGGKAIAGGKITANNIGGFTFLENPGIERVDGKTFYRDGSNRWSENEVIHLSLNVNPYNILAGYSPSESAKKWARVDDFIADYEMGYFQNGAVPAGEFVVTARSVDEFNAIVDTLQQKHRGAGKNNNVVYSHRPTDSVSGKALNSQIEWIPFSVQNKDMSLKELFEQTNKKLDMAFGVPAEIKGYIQNSNYASVNVADFIFDKRVVYPKALKIWTGFTHEMNRITGGLGFAISFDFEIPKLADEEKVRAETTQIELTTLANALSAGFALDSAVSALDLPESFAKLTLAPEPAPQEDLVTAPRDGDDLPDQAKSHQCSKKKQSGGVVNSDIESDLGEVIRKNMGRQIDRVIEKTKGVEDATEEEQDDFTDEMLAILIILMLREGAKEWASGLALVQGAGLPTSSLSAEYALSDTVKSKYREYLKGVAKSYTDDTAGSIRRTLERGLAEGWDTQKTAEELRNIIDLDEWRVQRLAKSETARASGISSLDAMERIQEQTGLPVYKVWHINPSSPNHCPDCLALNDTKIPIGINFLDKGEKLPDSQRLVDFTAIEQAHLHPNCGCYLTYEIGGAKAVKVHCQKCKRYMFESEGGKVKNFICQNSKCKRHWDVSIFRGQIDFIETPLDTPPISSVK